MEKRDGDLFVLREERGVLDAWVGGGGKRGGWGEVEMGGDGDGVAQERWRWRSNARRVDIRVSRM